MTENELEQLITTSGVGSRTAKKLRDAFNASEGGTDAGASPTRPASRGHGAPSANRTPVAVF